MRNLIRLLILGLIASLTGLGAQAQDRQKFTYEGVIEDSNGNPVDLTGKTAQFSIWSAAGNCAVYRESLSPAGDSEGNISHKIGSGAVLLGTYSDALFNTDLNVSGCILTKTDDRSLRVAILDGATPLITAVVPITSVPYSLESQAVAGFKPSNLVRAVDGLGNPIAAPSLTATQVSNLIPLLNGTSPLYTNPSSAVFTGIPRWNGTPGVGDSDALVNKAYVDSAVTAGLPGVGTSGTYTKVTTDAQGRVVAGTGLIEADLPTLSTAGKVSGNAITTGILGGTVGISTSGNLISTGTIQGAIVRATQLRLFNGSDFVQISAPSGIGGSLSLVLPSSNGSSGNVLSTDGAGNLSWMAPSTGSIASVGSAGNPIFMGGTSSNPTIGIYQAGNTLSGFLSSSDWNLFNNKLSSLTVFGGDISGTSANTVVDRIKSIFLSFSSLSSGNFLKYNGSAWVNSNLFASDIPSLDAAKVTTGVFGADRGGTGSGSYAAGDILYASGATTLTKLSIGSSGRVLTSSGSAPQWQSFLNVTQGGTGASTFGMNSVIVSNGTGSGLNSLNCGLGQVIKFDASQFATCGTDAGGVASVTSANAYLSVTNSTTTPLITANVGTTSNTLAAGDDARIVGSLQRAGGTMTGTINMGAQDITNTGNIVMASSKYLSLSNQASDPSTAGWTAAEKGRTWFNSATNEIKYWDGISIKVLGLAGLGLQSLNGSSNTAQSFAVGSTGSMLNISTSGGTHTFNLPSASGVGVTAGTISKFEYDTFISKMDTNQAFGGDVSGTASNMTVNRLRNVSVNFTGINSGQVLRYNGSAWVNAGLTFSDVSGVLSAAGGGTGIGTYNMGDMLYATGTTTLGRIGIASSGSVLTSNGAGFAPTWNPVNLAIYFQNNGNSFSAPAVLGTNDAQPLSFETNNTVRMTIANAGNVGIGNTAPMFQLHVGANTSASPVGQFEGPIVIRSNNNSTVSNIKLLNLDTSTNRGTALEFSTLNAGAAERSAGRIAGYLTDNTGGSEKGALTFSTANAGTQMERMRIDFSGNIGIGTTNTANRLTVVQGSGNMVRLATDDTLTQTVELGVQNGSSSIFRFPTTNGFSGQTLMATGSGNTSWGEADGYGFTIQTQVVGGNESLVGIGASGFYGGTLNNGTSNSGKPSMEVYLVGTPNAVAGFHSSSQVHTTWNFTADFNWAISTSLFNTNSRFFVGFSDNQPTYGVSTVPPFGSNTYTSRSLIGIRYTGGTDPNFMCISCNAGTCITPINTLIPANQSDFKMRIEYTYTPTTAAKIYINGGIACTIATNLPTFVYLSPAITSQTTDTNGKHIKFRRIKVKVDD